MKYLYSTLLKFPKKVQISTPESINFSKKTCINPKNKQIIEKNLDL